MPRLSGLDAILTLDGRVKVDEVDCRDQGTAESISGQSAHRVVAPGYPAATCCLFQDPVPYCCDQ